MKRILTLFAALCLLCTVNSCKKCYTCTEQCYVCMANGFEEDSYCTSDGTTTSSQFAVTCAALGGTVQDDNDFEITQSYCGKTSAAKSFKTSYEAAGLTCTED